jgi:hypothetical protein
MNLQTGLMGCRRWGRTVFIAGAAVLAGCTSQPLARTYVAPNSTCCSSVDQFDFQTVQLGQDVEFGIASSSPTFAFFGRREHFAAFRIADGSDATSLHVKSYLSSDLLPMATAVVPQFSFYDASLAPIGRSIATDAQPAGGFWRGAISGRAPVPSGTRYIIVTAADGSGGLPTLRSENGTRYQIPAAALGDLSLRLFGEATR